MAAAVVKSGLLVSRSQMLPAASVAAQHASSSYSTEVNVIKKPSLAALKRGTGGRSSFSGIVCTVFGASGFIGRYVCNRLGKIGTQVIIPYRSDGYDVLRLKLVGDLGQVLYQPFELRNEESIYKSIKYSNVVINLIGRDWETMNYKFKDVHVDGARRIARACRESGIEKLIHVSALNASENPTPQIWKRGSKFLQSKWEGECAVREEFPNAIIFRPSDVYGQEDRFVRYFAEFYRHQFHYMPLWKKGEHTVKQPVFVSDLAQGIVQAIKDHDAVGQTYQAVGPKRYLLSELVDWFHRVMRKDKDWGYWRYDMRFDPVFMARVTFNEMLPIQPPYCLTWEKIEREAITDQLVPGIPTLEDLGIQLTEMEHQVPWELRPFRAYQYYDAELGEFEQPAPPPIVA